MKRLICLFVVFTLCFSLCSCTNKVHKKAELKETSDSHSMFCVVEESLYLNWIVVYHKETKVMYAVSAASYNRGTFTLLVNADGTPMLYDGD